MPATTDFTVTREGSIALLHLITDVAHDWIADKLGEPGGEDGPLMFGDAVAIEGRYLGQILEGIAADNLTVEVDA